MFGQLSPIEAFYKAANKIDWHFRYSVARAARAFVRVPQEQQEQARDFLFLMMPPTFKDEWVKYEKEAFEDLAKNPPPEAPAASESTPCEVTVQTHTTAARCPVCGR